MKKLQKKEVRVINKKSKEKIEVRTKKKPSQKNKIVAIVGLGYVGLPLAILAEKKGYKIKGFDLDQNKVNLIKKRFANYLSTKEKLYFSKSKIDVESNISILEGADVYIVCVPTPVDRNYTPDLKPLSEACISVGKNIKKGSLVIIESTVSPSVCDKVALRIIENESKLKATKDFYFAHCPERINPGDEKWSLEKIPRVVGATDPKSLSIAKEFYESILDAEVFPMNSIKEAEAVKMVENSFRDINIAFVNELAMAFDKSGIDITNVLKGASTKPFGFTAFHPGCGVGGHCIPVDPYYLIRYGKENGFSHEFLKTARRINSNMPVYTVSLLQKALEEKNKKMEGARVALLGLSYKKDVPDLRESPAIEIRNELLKRGVVVNIFDPFMPEKNSEETLEKVLSKSDSAIIATDHTAFTKLSPKIFINQNIKIVIDGRNCLSKEDFSSSNISYKGIGR